MIPRILWLSDGKMNNNRSRVLNLLNSKGFDIKVACLTKDPRWKYPKGTSKDVRDKQQQLIQIYRKNFQNLSKQFDLIVVNSQDDLLYLKRPCKDADVTLHKYHGSLEEFGDSRYLVWTDMTHMQIDSTVHLQCERGIKQLMALFDTSVTMPPDLDYEVVETSEGFHKFKQDASDSVLIGIDIETTGRPPQISCIGFACVKKDGKIKTYVIPFRDYSMEKGLRMSLETEIEAWDVVDEVCSNDVCKVFANGSFDTQHLMRMGIRVRHWWLDTQYVQHSYYIESSKSLKSVTSYYNPLYRYWKDELVQSSEGDKYSVPETKSGMNMYLKYNAKDCHYTAYSAIKQFNEVCGISWAYNNYANIMLPAVLGPTALMNHLGLNVDRGAFFDVQRKANAEYDKLLEEWHYYFPDVNPSSSPAVSRLIYQDLHATPVKVKHKDLKTSTESATLDFVTQQGYVLSLVCELLIKIRKQKKICEAFESGSIIDNNYLYQMKPAGTQTMRYSSSSSNFFTGRNVQNIPKKLRFPFTADPGRTLICADYSASDSWFVAFCSRDKRMMKSLRAGDDMHLRSVEAVFGIPYEEGMRLKKEGHTTERTTIKPVTHGISYMSGTGTLFVTLGTENLNRLYKLTAEKPKANPTYELMYAQLDQAIAKYKAHYHECELWKITYIQDVKRKGGIETFYGGFTRRFQCNLDDQAIGRKVISTAGQAGTAMNIHLATFDLYWGGLMEEGLHIHAQVHDELVMSVPTEKLQELLPKIVDTMERTCTIHGEDFVVPVEAEYGHTWAKDMKEFHYERK